MLRHDLKRMARALAAAALLWSAAGTASAAGADAGNTVSNTASVVYSVNSVVQPAVASLAVDFLVDRLVDFTVTEVVGTEVVVTPNSNGAFLFTITNTSNAALGFNLSATNNATNPFAPPADSFDPTTLTAVVDAGTIGTYEPLVDVVTTVDSVAEDGFVGVWVIAAIQPGLINNDVAAVSLAATARETGGGGLVLTEQANPENPAAMETVFNDGAGLDDIAQDGIFSRRGAFIVASADVTISKTETLISDPINGAAPNARRIPGAVVEYVITVSNGALSALSATTLTISDVIPPDVTYSAGTIDLDGTPQTDATGDDNGEFTVGPDTVTVTVATLAPGADAVITFRVTVD